jgi:hypothetical protein
MFYDDRLWGAPHCVLLRRFHITAGLLSVFVVGSVSMGCSTTFVFGDPHCVLLRRFHLPPNLLSVSVVGSAL